ncbi:hypothetical protein [Actinomadura sp. KC06]|uniref:S8 family serine peptidase n=1 Tax=Actinomadura sp. KC06 TaxID=2530369 RepID=UPI0026A93D2B
MASPHVAGAGAPYLENHPAAKPPEVTHVLVNNSTKGIVGDAGPDSKNRLLFTNTSDTQVQVPDLVGDSLQCPTM